MLAEQETHASGSGHGQRSGHELTPSLLKWYHISDGTRAFTLHLGAWESDPVEVEVSEGEATPDAILFEMNSK